LCCLAGHIAGHIGQHQVREMGQMSSQRPLRLSGELPGFARF
jgi:hypothetical protein